MSVTVTISGNYTVLGYGSLTNGSVITVDEYTAALLVNHGYGYYGSVPPVVTPVTPTTPGSGGVSGQTISNIPTNHFYQVTAQIAAIDNAQFMAISKSATSVKIKNNDATNLALVAVGDTPLEACENLSLNISYLNSFVLPPNSEIGITNSKNWFAYAGVSSSVSLQITQYR